MKFIKKNILVIIFFVFALAYCFIIYNNMNNNYNNELQNISKTIEICKSMGENEKTDDMNNYCEQYLNDKYETMYDNFYVKFFNVCLYDIHFFNIIACLVLFVISLYGLIDVFRYKSIIMMLQREKYSSFLRKFFLKAYRYLWFWPLIMLLIFGICMINSNFNPFILINYGMNYGEKLMSNVPMFIFLYILNVVIFSGFYINICLIIARKQHNYFLAIIESFLVIIALELFLEIGVNAFLFGKILHDYSSGLVFNIVNLFSFSIPEYKNGVQTLFVFNISCFFISLICVFLAYRNKEKLIIDCEKNI